MGLRLLPLLLLAWLATGCAVIAGAQRQATPRPPERVSIIRETSQQGPKTRLNETVTRRIYLVEGANVPEIRANLLSEGSSQAAGGSHYDAVTAWSLHWSFRYDRGPSQCALAAANIDLQIEVRLPELARDEALDPALLERWRAYAVALETHEMGHVDRETAVVEALRDEFENAAPGPDCGEVGQRLNQIGADYQRQVSITDAVYDQETGHGATQGAVFP